MKRLITVYMNLEILSIFLNYSKKTNTKLKILFNYNSNTKILKNPPKVVE